MLKEMDIVLSGHQFKKLCEIKFESIMEKYGLRRIEIEIMQFISDCGEKDTAKDIASLQYISKAHISHSIDDLIRKQYLSYVEDAHDRRCIHLSLTEDSKSIMEEIKIVRQGIEEILFENITEQDREIALKVAQKMVSNIGRELKKYR